MKNKHFAILYWIFAGLYLALHTFRPYPGSFIIKAIPALSISYLLFSSKNKLLYPMAIGFIFSSFGDVFLDLDRQRFFIFGLLSFLLAHVGYSVTFLKFYKKSQIPVLKVSLVVAYCLVMGYLIFPTLGKMTIPVLVYVLVIGIMGITAGLSTQGFSLVFIGALIFMISDGFIAVDKFMTPVPGIGPIVMITYFTGNFLIGYFTAVSKTYMSNEAK